MTQTCEGPPRGGSADGPIDAVCLLSSSAADVQTNSPIQAPAHDKFRNSRAVREAKLQLTRDLLHETLGWARIYAATAQTFAEIGDDTGALFSLKQFHKAATAACQAGRLIREGRGEIGGEQ